MSGAVHLPALVIALALPASPSFAQQALVPPQSDISRQRLPDNNEPDTHYDFTIQNPERAAIPRSVDEVEFVVAQITVRGVESVSPEQVKAIFSPLEGQNIRLEQLRQAASQLENLYRNQGYFLTRVFIPPQQVRDGNLEVMVVEGHIASLTVNSPNAASERLGQAIMAPTLGRKMPRLAEVENALERLNAVPGLSANGILRAGERLGETEMVLQLARPRTTLRAEVTNTSSQELGPMAYSLSSSFGQPFGRPGSLTVFLAAAGEGLAELQSAGMRVSAPVISGRAILSLGGLVAHARPGGQIRALEVRSNLASLTASLSGALLRHRSAFVTWDAGFTWTSSRVDALAARLSHDRTSVIELRITGQKRDWLGGDLTVSASIAHGLGIFGASPASLPMASIANFEPAFTRVTWSVRRDQALLPELRATGTIRGQHTSATLLSAQQVAYGGPEIGRAFDPSTVTGDRGLGFTGEVQFSPRIRSTWFGHAQFYVFADAAWVGYAQPIASNLLGDSLASVGAGLRADLFRHLALDVQVAHAVSGWDLARNRPTRVNFSAALHF